MKTLIKFIFAAIVLAIASLNMASLGYCSYDNLASSPNQNSVAVGNWIYETDFTDLLNFESFTNNKTGVVNTTINGVAVTISGVLAATTSTDQKIGNKSARITKNGYFLVNEYYSRLKTISFYMGLTKYSTIGSKKYTVQVSNNGSSWTTIYTKQAVNTSFDFITIDMETLLKSGLTLTGGTIATRNTPLKIKITTSGLSNSTSSGYNLDNLSIVYSVID